MASQSGGTIPGCAPTPGRGGIPETSPVKTDSCLNRTPETPKEVCFWCKKPGHWYRNCPARANGSPRTPDNSSTDSSVPEKQCRCGGGPCLVLTSHTVNNPERKFYKCPVKTAGRNCKFFQWCDSPSSSSSASDLLDFGLYPMCECGAGRAKLSFSSKDAYAGRRCFVCPITKGQGACNFLLLADDLIKDMETSKIPAESSKQVDLSGFVRPIEIRDTLPYGNDGQSGDIKTVLVHGSDRDGSLRNSPTIDCQTGAGTAHGPQNGSPLLSAVRKLNFEDDAAPVASPIKRRPGNCYRCGKPGHWVVDCYSPL